MGRIGKAVWFTLGIACLIIAYIGVITPGIPWSTPAVAAAFCFAKSSKRWHDWIMNHKLFGPFLSNWKDKRVFPTKGKWVMVITMDISLVVLWITTGNWKLVLSIGLMMLLVSIWAFRFPGSVEEWQARKDQGKKIGWLR